MIRIDVFKNWLDQASDDGIAIEYNGSRITYQNVKEDVNKLSSFLVSKKFCQNDYIPIIENNSYEFILYVFAVWNIGAIPIPLNPKLKSDELIVLLKELKVNRVITAKEIDLHGIESITPNEYKKHKAKDNLVTSFNINNIALILFTSGSTGKPKGVIHTFKSLASSVNNTDQITNTIESDKWLASLPFFHIGGFLIIIRALLTGSTILLPKTVSTDEIIESIKKDSPTIISLVPTVFQRLLNEKVTLPSNIKKVFIGGSHSPEKLVLDGLKLGWPLVKVYGSSETGAMISAIEGNELKSHPTSSGKPFNNVEVQIDGLDGDILVKPDSLFQKYLNENESPFTEDGFFRTGDRGYLDFNGYLYIQTRADDIIISGGENIDPIEIEKVINSFDGIVECKVFGKKDSEWGEAICSAFVGSEQIDIEKLKNYLKSKLTNYKIPKYFYQLDEIPKTELGKVNKDVLIKLVST